MRPVGSVYLQTNGVDNAIIRYGRHANGSLVELVRIPTRGKGSGTFKPITGQESAPNAFEGVGSVLLSPDHRLLFATNGGDNTVSSFQVAPDGKLTLLDVQPTGQPVRRRSGTAKSLAYSPRTRIQLRAADRAFLPQQARRPLLPGFVVPDAACVGFRWIPLDSGSP